MNIHMNRPNAGGDAGDAEGEINLDKMKRYIAYCKSYVEADACAVMWLSTLTTCSSGQKMRTSAVARSTGDVKQPLRGVEEAGATGGTGQRREKLHTNNRSVCSHGVNLDFDRGADRSNRFFLEDNWKR